MANDLTFEQISSILNSVVSQATGSASITPTNTSEFVSVAQTALKTGYDPVMGAITQVLAKTVFSVRPYYEKFKGLRVDSQKWGAITRKLQVSDQDFVNNDAYNLVDGQTIDQYIVRKPNVLQTNFYGVDTYSDYTTIFDYQLNNAFKGPDEFGEFLSLQLQTIADKHAQSRENLARACVANFIGGKADAQNGVIHLLTEYNTVTGANPALTAITVMQPGNFQAFCKWAYSRIAEVSAMLTERTQMYQINITGKEINHHTPYEKQRVFMYAPARFQTEARVLADTYHDNYIRYAADETVNFWQSAETPDEIQVVPSYTGTNGAVITPQSTVTVSNIFAAIIDEEAAGYTIMNERMYNTPFNARGSYYNIWWHMDRKYYNDHTEKGVIFLLD